MRRKPVDVTETALTRTGGEAGAVIERERERERE